MKKYRKAIVALVLANLIAFLSARSSPNQEQDPDYYNEPYRNQFHFSPEANWMNDPNGMVFYKGEYHLFYQYHPNGTKWGPMHWGHAVSKDLVHWEHLPIALSPDKNGQIFSGSAVIDWENTAGFGKEAMVAIFTHAGDVGQVQSLAYSLDKGRTWEKYEGNPVMPNPPLPDWRDPKVFWHKDTERWVMSLAAKDKIMFYTSRNFKEWEYASEFGQDGGIQANSLDRTSYAVSSLTGASFTYEGDITLHAKNSREGAGGLVFRADQSADNGYVVSLDAQSDVITLSKVVKGITEELARKSAILETSSIYHIKVDADGDRIQVHVNGQAVIDYKDQTFDYGHFGLAASNSPAGFRNVKFQNTSSIIEYQNRQSSKNIKTDQYDIINPDFETGDLTGWNIIRGDAFTNDHVTDAASYWGGDFGRQGDHHLWGFSDLHKGDDATGELHSSYFKLGGSGEINFLLSGGNLTDSLYVSLVRASDDQELIRQANTRFAEEKYQRYVWDASKYIGEVLYLKVVDLAEGSWGHMNLDDVHVYNEGAMPDQVDQVAQEPQKAEVRSSGLISDWTAVAGNWVPSSHGSIGGVWECPTLIELPIDGNPEQTKWVLQVSINDGAPAGGSGMQYFVGSFDGTTFKNENPSDQVLWTDYGADFYAAVDWSGIDGEHGEKYWLGWMSNWQYANFTPTLMWRGSMTLPRTMELTQTNEGLQLKQTPVSLSSIRDKSEMVSYENEVISGSNKLLSALSEDTFEMIAEFDVSDTTASEFGFEVRKGKEEYTTIGYDVVNQRLFVDRSKSGFFDYGSNLMGKHEGPLRSSKGTVKMHIFVDRSAVEVFGNDGVTVITDQIFPEPDSKGVSIYSKSGAVKLKSLEIYPLKTSWR